MTSRNSRKRVGFREGEDLCIARPWVRVAELSWAWKIERSVVWAEVHQKVYNNIYEIPGILTEELDCGK